MKLGRYEIVRELGKGAMGVVYLAKDPVIGRLVALKTVRLIDLSDDEESREHQQRFIREAQAAGILSHPSIVTVHDIGEVEDSAMSFIAMQYVEGPNLKELIQRREPPDYANLSGIVAQIAEALDYAHAKGIIHRDVKPANIIVCADGTAKITDFGIAKIASIASNLTTTGQFIGTPNYMAPEQVKGSPVDGRSDLFSLGIVLYEALTGRKPFSGDSLTTISYKIVHEDYPPLREVVPEAPEEFDQILERALAKSPDDRYQRGAEMAADLRRLQKRLLAPGEAHGPLSGDPTLLSQTPTTPGLRPQLFRPGRHFTLPPVLRRRVHPAIFAIVVIAALAAAIIPAVYLWRGRATVPPVDVERESTMHEIRDLRREAATLLAEGNVSAAYQRFKQIQRLRPASPANNRKIAQLEQVLSEQELEQRRMEDARAIFEEGVELFKAEKWEDSIRKFEESFALNPREETVVNYLRMARERLNLRDLRRQIPQAGASAQNDGPSSVTGTATLLTIATTTVADGYLLVRVGGRTVVHENFWIERAGFIRRRVTRDLTISGTVPAGQQEVEVWVVVPSRNINTRRSLTHEFPPGSRHTLRIVADPQRDSYQVSVD